MCGIAGTVGDGWTREEFEKLFSSIRHRGPDDSGTFRKGAIQLGMHRLKFRGPSVSLPLKTMEGVAAYNGQIYGSEAGDAPYRPVTTGMEGELSAALSPGSNPDGMYAFSVATPDDGQVYLQTDPHFIKPLFYRKTVKGVAFCSEIEPLIHLAETNTIHRPALAELFCYGWYLGDQSYVSDISLAWKNDVSTDGVTIRHHKKRELLKRNRLGDASTTLKSMVRDSVARCLDGDGPIGIAVSGGLDSSILAWELNAAGVENISTFSVCTAGENDGLESLTQLNLPAGGAWETWRHTVVTVQDEEFLRLFEASTRIFGQPTTMSSLPLYYRLAEIAAEAGVRALILGEGVDEYFGGYASYSKVRSPSDIAAYYDHGPRDRLARILFRPEEIDGAKRRFGDAYGKCTDIRQIEVDLRLTRLLLRTDTCLMSKSIEGRVPYLHNNIPQLAASLPWDALVRGGGKTILRDAYASNLGPQAYSNKQRFKASDQLLHRCLADRKLTSRIVNAVGGVFAPDAVPKCIDLLKTPEGFDADIACLLISMTFLIESGGINGYSH